MNVFTAVIPPTSQCIHQQLWKNRIIYERDLCYKFCSYSLSFNYIFGHHQLLKEAPGYVHQLQLLTSGCSFIVGQLVQSGIFLSEETLLIGAVTRNRKWVGSEPKEWAVERRDTRWMEQRRSDTFYTEGGHLPHCSFKFIVAALKCPCAFEDGEIWPKRSGGGKYFFIA